MSFFPEAKATSYIDLCLLLRCLFDIKRHMAIHHSHTICSRVMTEPLMYIFLSKREMTILLLSVLSSLLLYPTDEVEALMASAFTKIETVVLSR